VWVYPVPPEKRCFSFSEDAKQLAVTERETFCASAALDFLLLVPESVSNPKIAAAA
jgi:hypothetical protein